MNQTMTIGEHLSQITSGLENGQFDLNTPFVVTVTAGEHDRYQPALDMRSRMISLGGVSRRAVVLETQ